MKDWSGRQKNQYQYCRRGEDNALVRLLSRVKQDPFLVQPLPGRETIASSLTDYPAVFLGPGESTTTGKPGPLLKIVITVDSERESRRGSTRRVNMIIPHCDLFRKSSSPRIPCRRSSIELEYVA